nr:glycosyltransferase family 4 protein [Gramella oceanisediminis]
MLEGQLTFMNKHYEVIAISAEEERLKRYGQNNRVRSFPVEMTREITPFQDLKALFKLYRFLKKENPLIIHTHTPKAGIIGMLAGKLAGTPIRLHTVAGLPLLEVQGKKRKILDKVEKLTYSLATRVYPNSFELKKIILQLGYSNESKLKVLGHGSSNGIDTKYFDPALFSTSDKRKIRKDLEIPDSDFIYIFVGRLVREKGINELVRAFEKVNQEYPDTTLLLVGPFEDDLDPLDAEIMQIIKTHPKIFTTGYQEDVRPYFAVSDVLSFPSYREGFPNVVMQANAMGLPAIVSNINGCNEIVENGENGMIIPVKSESALYEAMLDIKRDGELFSRISRKARKLIQEKYERAQFWDILLKEYKELELLYKHD